MSLIIQKFGGTSLGTPERLKKVSAIIRDYRQHSSLIVVVSAMSSHTKAEGTTSRLIQAGELALAGKDFSACLDAIEQTHRVQLQSVLQHPEILQKIEKQIHTELQGLRSFLTAIQIIKEISPRSEDMIIGTGERLSAMLVAGMLQDQGIHAQYVNLSTIVDSSYSEIDVAFYQMLYKNFSQILPDTENMIPVVTGYFGFVPGGILENIGRGYTDLTSALMAAATHAQELQIWKEVDGIFTADPRKVKNAQVLSMISPTEAAELTFFGSEVLHPFTMEQAMKANVPIRIKNTLAPHQQGTVIIPNSHSNPQTQSNKQATAATTKFPISILNIYSNRMLHSTGFLSKVFDILKSHHIVVDLISTSEVNISCTLPHKEEYEALITELSTLGTVTLKPHYAIISLVGENMILAPGTAAKMFSALAKQNINIEMITQGASEINISCVVKEEVAIQALQTIHQTFLESE